MTGFAHHDETAAAERTVAAARSLAVKGSPDEAAARARLVAELAHAGRTEEAIAQGARALQCEGLELRLYDRIFTQLAALAETAIEAQRPQLDARRLPRPPEIDGELNDWWRPWSGIELAGPRYVQQIQMDGALRPGTWRGEEDLSATLYLGWDDRGLYFALDVNDLDLRPFDTESERWIGDCLLIALDTKDDGGFWPGQDDEILSLALVLPKKKNDKKKPDQEDDEENEDEKENRKAEGKYFVKKKDDGSGVIYEAMIPWAVFEKKGGIDATRRPVPGFRFGFNIVLTDDDGERITKEEALESGRKEGEWKGAQKTLEITPSVLLQEKKSRLWQGFVPEHFAKVTLR